MSVIAGLVSRTQHRTQTERIGAMLAGLREHHPDGDQVLDCGACALGVARLTTAAAGRRSEGFHEAGDVHAVVDGRLDRSDELRVFLGLEKNASDAEIAVAAYARMGTECVSRFRGDFALAIWDGRLQTLLAARDSFAIRPLCYAVTDRWVAIASDPEQVLAAGLVSSDPDDDMVIDYLLWDARLVDRTFFREIKALPAGHMLVAGPAGLRVSRFRAAALNRVHLSSRMEYWAEYRRRFALAVESCITSRSPVVTELSGGLDSSSIVCMSDRLLREKPALCPSLVAAAGLYPGLACDEEPFIRAVAEHVRVPVECWNGTEGSVNELDPSSVAVPGGRFATFAGTEGQVHIARAHGARVLVSGVGGDQIGTAAGAIRDAVTELRLADAARMTLGRPGANAMTVAGTVGALARSFVPRSLRTMRAALRPRDRRPPWLSAWARRHPRPRPEIDFPPQIETEIQRRSWRSLTSGPHALIMTYLQHHAVRSGVEIRFPFLDLDLVALALSIPSQFWPPPWPFERLHRDILKDLLPSKIVARRSKANFKPAVLLRVRRHLPFIRDIFSSSRWESERFVDQGAARRLLGDLDRAEDPEFSTISGVWNIARVEAWLRAISRYSHPLKRSPGNG